MKEVRCNGAGEMPGQEGRDSYNEHYVEWIEKNAEKIIETYRKSIEHVDDIPDDFIEAMYQNQLE